jgi:hypothetical protein
MRAFALDNWRCARRRRGMLITRDAGRRLYEPRERMFTDMNTKVLGRGV